MKPEDFEIFVSIFRQRSGFQLTREKAYLLESRLMPAVRKYNLKSLDDLATMVRTRRDEALLHDITQAMTNNDTWFFRDNQPFTLLRKTLIPDMVSSRVKLRRLRIWCAGCASGQEAYSIAMVCLEEQALLDGWQIEVIGTDLSRPMIEQARKGVYSQLAIQRGLPASLLVKYCELIGPDKWQVTQPVQRLVQFREGNLLQETAPGNSCDLILCRNVVSGFDAPTRGRVFASLANALLPEGVLMLGNGETTTDVYEKLKPLGTGTCMFGQSAARV